METVKRGETQAYPYRVFAWMLLAALTFIVTMAFISNASNRIHPDEFDHVAAARFYFDNWLPPPVADPRTLDSYSYAGVSYLNEWDVVYLLAGKFALLTQPFVQSEVYALRCFNLFLFLVLTCLAWTRRDDILTFCILLLSPQIWYIFSYFNADAFPMFLALLAVYELTSPRTAFNDCNSGCDGKVSPSWHLHRSHCLVQENFLDVWTVRGLLYGNRRIVVLRKPRLALVFEADGHTDPNRLRCGSASNWL